MPDLRDDAPPNSLRDEVRVLSDRGDLRVSDVRDDERAKAELRSLARSSLYFLAKGVLGYNKLVKQSHRPICEFIQDLSIQRGLVLLPRGVYKTTIGTVAFIIWLLINDPNRTVLIANQIARHAERMLLEIEEHLGGANQWMNLLFPEIIKPNDKHKPWNQMEMTVPNRTQIRSTASIVTLGVGARSESIHTDFQVNDDLVGVEDMFSDLNRDNALTWHDYERNLFVEPKTGIERMYGTRWPGNDFYKPIIASGEYRVYWKSPVEDDGTLNFPSIYDHEELRKLRNRNWLMYNANILNKEVHPGSLEFKPEQLNYYRLLPDKKGYFCRVGDKDPKDYLCSDGDVIIIVDTAASGDLEDSNRSSLKKRDLSLSNNAIMVLMAHSEKFFILDTWAGRGKGENPELQIAVKLMEMCQQWRGYFRKIYLEAFGAHGQFKTIFNMVCRQNNCTFLIEDLPKGTKISKDVRIRSAVGPVAQNGQLYVRRNQDQFIDEFTNFSSGMKDLLDCLTWGIGQVRMPLSEVSARVESKTLNARKLRRLRFVGRAGY